MAIILDPKEPAIRRGIKTVGVGKKGSQAMDAALTAEVLADLKAGRATPAAIGAFLAGLLTKGLEPQEMLIAQAFPDGALQDPQKIVEAIASDAPVFVQWICVQLLSGHTLDRATACELGRFLFSDQPGDGARGLVASLLRVRYETDDEYEGLWQAIQETIQPNFRTSTPDGEPIVQMAEPFDGNDHSYLITPIVAGFIQAQGYRVVNMIGRNSGPKLVFNLHDIMKFLPDTQYCLANQDLAKPLSATGYYIRQVDISPALDRWVGIRHQTIKRPFLATLEKFIKPVDARIVITSAFHPPYGEKMTTISERAGFPGVMVIRNGIEGSIAFPLKRPAKILLSARQENGTYIRHEINMDVESFLGITPAMEERREQLTAQENTRLIQSYLDQGTSHDEWFDLRVKATCEGVRQGLEWLERNITWRG